jgi:hypothetical protein
MDRETVLPFAARRVAQARRAVARQRERILMLEAVARRAMRSRRLRFSLGPWVSLSGASVNCNKIDKFNL